MRPKPIQVLLVEDNPSQALLLEEGLKDVTSVDVDLHHVALLREAIQRLQERAFDVVLLDLSLPDSSGLDTVARIHAAAPQTAIVVLTTLSDEALGLEAVREGAQDYLVKGETDHRALVRAMRHAIERQQTLQALHDALATVKRLSGLLPMCSSCKRIRDDRGYWTEVEQYIDEHSEAAFTHSICPECTRKLYGDYLAEPGADAPGPSRAGHPPG